MKKLLVSLFCVVVLTMGLSAGEKEEAVFPFCFEIGGDKPGMPHATISLLANSMKNSFIGHGEIFWAVSPPVDIKAQLRGGFKKLYVMREARNIVMVLTGYPVIKWPPHAGIGPVISPNCYFFINFSGDWLKGSATIEFVDGKGKWHEFKDLPVKEIECFKKK